MRDDREATLSPREHVMKDYDIFEIGDLPLQSGATLKDARLAYKTYGTLDPDGRNVVLLPTFFTGTHHRNEACFGPGRAIDPARHFIVSINLFGNGLSTSPSNASCGQDRSRFPSITLFDNVSAQHRLLTERLSVKHIALVAGWSVAAIQAYQWGTQYPDLVGAILPFCGSARCSPHNYAFLDGPKSALEAAADWQDGNYAAPPVKGLKAFARVYVAWGYSQAFFRDGLYRELGFETLEDLVRDWEQDHLKWDANDLLSKIWTWQHADVSNNVVYRGDFAMALGNIRARAIIMPVSTDLYFPPDDNAREVQLMQRAKLRIFDSPWGHCGGAPGRLEDFSRAFDTAAAELLGS
jgi:homoserine O-acetyltransferase